MTVKGHNLSLFKYLKTDSFSQSWLKIAFIQKLEKYEKKYNKKIVVFSWIEIPKADLGMSLDLKSSDQDLKAVTPEKSKACTTAFTNKLVTTFKLSRTRSGHVLL